MLLQFITNGIITGLLYSLLAIGFALVYNTTHIFHIAAAGIYVFAAYMFWLFGSKLGQNIMVAAVVAIVLTMGISLLSEKGIYGPLRKKQASLNLAMIASIGLMTIIVNTIAMTFGNETKVIDSTILPTISLGKLIVSTPQLYQLIISVATIAMFLAFLNKTKFGLRLQALSADDTLFETLGYDKNRTFTFVFLASGLFIGLASCLTVFDIGMDPRMGMTVLINALVAMIIGGVGRFETCVFGGISLGVLQSLTVYFFSSNWQNAITFALLLIFLFVRPQGIAGYKQRLL
ncbi:MAG: branched-chain amino acid ABC transporter permease [Bacteroidaceae bacterium]|nr:branched-chain amino acid ABC transporter permease [Bacteroidaceae bacterium]